MSEDPEQESTASSSAVVASLGVSEGKVQDPPFQQGAAPESKEEKPARPAVVDGPPGVPSSKPAEVCEKTLAVVGMFQVRIDSQGKVIDAELQMTKNSPACAEALRSQIMAMRFEPCDNVAVACEFPYAMATMIHW